MNLVQLQSDLAKHFPKVWIKEGAAFDNRHSDSLWTGEGSEIEVADPEDGSPMGTIPAFDYYDMSGLYEFGVYKGLSEFLAERGYFAEAYDGGTYFIWKI